MQTELPNTPPADFGNRLTSRALSPVLRRIVLGIWLGLLLSGTVALWPVRYFDDPFWSFVFFNFWLTQAGLLAMWAGLARQPLTVRLPQALGFGVVLMLTSLWANSRSEDSFPVSGILLLFPVLFLVLFASLSLVRWLLGWRIGLPEEGGLTARRTTTLFCLHQLLIWTSFTAILLAWVKCLPSDGNVPREVWQGQVVGHLCIVAFAGGLYLTILLPSVGLVLARRNRRRFALGTIPGISLSTLGLLYITSINNGPSHFDWPNDALQLVGLEGGFLAPLFGTLLVFRICGYRLLRLERALPAPTEPSLTDAGNRLASRALPPVQRWIVLGMWMGLLLFSTVILYPGSPDADYWYAGWLGTCFAQACLPAVWVALPRQPLGVHLPGALMLEAVLMVTTAWTSWRSTNDLDGTLTHVISLLVCGAVLLAPLALIRRLVGWRIALDQRPADQRSMQFSLRQLLVWMGATAVLLAWATSVLPGWPSFEEAWQEFYVSRAIVFGAVFGAFCLPLLLPVVRLILGRKHRLSFAPWALAGASLFIPGNLLLASDSRPSDWDEICMLAVSEGCFLGVLLGTLLLLRICGYRLLRRKEEPFAAQSPAIADPQATMKPPRLWRTPFPYLVGAMLLVGGLLCWPAWKREAVRRESALQWEFQAVGMMMRAEEGHTEVGCYPSRPVSNAGLEKLQKLRTTPTFETLDFFHASLTDNQVHYLCGLATLRFLSLSGTRITDAGLAQLSGLDNLQHLGLDFTQITDAGLKHLTQFADLESLDLSGTCITGAGLAQLSSLPKLRVMSLESTRVTDASLAHLAKLTNLQTLWLAQTSITDAGMEHLAQLTNLEELHLAGTKVTDAGLIRLRPLKKLRTLDKGPTTPAGLETFHQALPQCEIKSDEWGPQEK